VSYLPFSSAGHKESQCLCNTVWYAIESLIFYYINSPESIKSKVESKMAVIRVSGGSLTAANVTFEMERLFPGGWR